MKDTEFFERALGLTKPWEVKTVRMDMANRKVEIEIECTAKTVWIDPQSGERLHIQGYEERQWRHLDTMQFETVLIAEVPRVKYPDGHTENVKTPWADRYARFTQMFEVGPFRCSKAAGASLTHASCWDWIGVPPTRS